MNIDQVDQSTFGDFECDVHVIRESSSIERLTLCLFSLSLSVSLKKKGKRTRKNRDNLEIIIAAIHTKLAEKPLSTPRVNTSSHDLLEEKYLNHHTTSCSSLSYPFTPIYLFTLKEKH